MRTLSLLPVLVLAGAAGAYADACATDVCVKYTLNFQLGSGTHLPTGTFIQDLTTPLADEAVVSWNGFSFDFQDPPIEDLPYDLQRYSQFDPNQANILAACEGPGQTSFVTTDLSQGPAISQETLNILKGCGGPNYTVVWEGQGLPDSGFSTWRFYLGFLGVGNNFFVPTFGSSTDPLITELGTVTITASTSTMPEPRGSVLVATVICFFIAGTRSRRRYC